MLTRRILRLTARARAVGAPTLAVGFDFVQTGCVGEQGGRRALQGRFEGFRAGGIDPDVW